MFCGGFSCGDVFGVFGFGLFFVGGDDGVDFFVGDVSVL